ncbi:MAG TPA: NADH-quinone oxidoreductase subunit N [Methylomirabilota bacterium]|nr:NADH-quinone oxidoreductase subunit N [Methylomirabilota bacterium]
MNPQAAAPLSGPASGALVFPTVDLYAILPVLVLTVTAAVVMLLDLLPPRGRKDHLGFVGMVGVVAAMGVTLWLLVRGGETRAFRGMVALDGYALFFNLVIGYATGLVLLLSMDYIRREGMESGEFYILILLAAVGMMLMASAGDLIIIFLALETMSLSLYVLAGFFRTRLEAGEASMKYFLLGAFASGFFLYGIALVFGATGSTNLDRIANAVAAGAGRDPLLVTGVGLLLVGFGFKISSVPFHMWAADVYEGAPTSVTAFIATGSKAAAFAALLRVLLSAVRGAPLDWTMLVWVLAVLTMTLGNVVAIAQQNLKRMLAYSSIAHVGYMLVGVVAGGVLGNGSVLFYLLIYTFTTAGAFGAILLLERGSQEAVRLEDFGGLASRHPLMALALSVFLLSLIGIPPTAGFVGKFYLFGAAVRSGYIWLAVIGVLNSAVAAYYYLRLIVYMYMREPEGAPTVLAPSFSGTLALVVALWGVLQLGVLPAPVFDLAQSAVLPLLR